MEGDCDDCGQQDAEADKDWMFQDSFLLLVFKNDLRATEECETVCFTDFLRIGHITHELFPEAPVFGIVSGTSVLLLLCRFLFRCRPTFRDILPPPVEAGASCSRTPVGSVSTGSPHMPCGSHDL